MFRLLSLALLCTCCLVGASTAQGQPTVVVDIAGGPGSDTTDLQLGIFMASPGGTVIVRPAPQSMNYPQVFINQSVTLRGEEGAPPTLSQVSIGSLNSTQRVVLSNVFIREFGVTGLVVDNCFGRVHLDRIQDGTVGIIGLDVAIRSSSSVTMTDCGPFHTIVVEDSRVAATNVTATAPGQLQPATVPTIQLVRSTLSLANSVVSGVTAQAALCSSVVVATPAVSLEQSELSFDRATSITGGVVDAIFPSPMICGMEPAFVGPSGTVRGPTAAGSEPGITFVQENVFPATVNYDASGDLLVSVAAEGNPGGYLFLSPLATATTVFAPFVAWVNFTMTIPVGFIAADGQGDCVYRVQAPSSLVPFGTPLSWQWLVATPTGAVLGEPAVTLVR